MVDAPIPHQGHGLMAGGRVVITEDVRGVAELLAGRLEAAGVPVDRLGHAARPVDWTSPAAIDALVAGLRERGPIAGIVHALPLGQALGGAPDAAGWAERVGDAVKGLFLLVKATAADLQAAAQAGGACLVAASALGGRFASAGSAAAEFFPGHGGIAGLVKTLAREWPRVRCRVVDLAPGDPAAALAGRLAREVFAGDGWAEVGYDADRRIRLRTVESPLPLVGSFDRGQPALTLELRPGEPVVVTGGARGITALVAAELARAWQPTLLVVGTTPMPVADESPETAGLVVEAEIKAALHGWLRRQGRPGHPVELESSYQALRRAREVRANLARCRQAGARVDYARADVRDLGALSRILDDWRRRYGEPVGLIHGAGLIKDKLIREKSIESFDRVLGTKLEGALNLLRLMRPDALRFTAFFSSIAGRFGNIGQSDYAAANEVLNKLAQWLDRRWPGRVLSVNWGPWSGVGMVSQLEDHLGRRGLGMIAPEAGPALLIDELRYGRKGDVEVLYAGGLGTLEQPIRAEPVAPPVEASR
jgi:NAD(P)-dependent dehydrogenase (short-subunit alcohol dehydrogenase family)